MWAVRVVVPAARADGLLPAIEAVLAPIGSALSLFEIDRGRYWQIESLCEARPQWRSVAGALGAIGAPAPIIAYVPPRDWVSASQRLRKPIRAGQFFIHGAHFQGRAPRGAIALEIDAGLAFGTGRHETTRGCLLELQRLKRAGAPIVRLLDLGCGSAILALAMARLWRRPVLAADNDPQAVAVARQNAIINGEGARVRVVKSQGFAARALGRAGPFDLIVANILAGPLCRLARGFARHLAPGGLLVVSGLMVQQEDAVAAAQARQGLALRRRRRLGDWSVLVFEKPKSKRRRPGR